jgi:F0F1-type ATP synthase membrane subunit b/b'
MGNIASAVCIVGATAVIIAKPACNFVKHRLEAVEADIKKAIKLIEETNESLDKVKQTIDELPNRESETVLRAIDNIVKTNEMLPNKMEEVMLKTVEGVNMLQNKMEEMMLETVEGVTRTNRAVNMLPETIEATAKKYSMYLHDEHVNMFELMSGLCPSPAISPRSYASEGTNRNHLITKYKGSDKVNFFKGFNPSLSKNGKENF